MSWTRSGVPTWGGFREKCDEGRGDGGKGDGGVVVVMGREGCAASV